MLPSTTESDKNNHKLKSPQHINSVLLVITVGSHRRSLLSSLLAAQLHFVSLYHFVKWCSCFRDAPINLHVYVLPASAAVDWLEACVYVAARALPAVIYVNPLLAVRPPVVPFLPADNSRWVTFFDPFFSHLPISLLIMYAWALNRPFKCNPNDSSCPCCSMTVVRNCI